MAKIEESLVVFNCLECEVEAKHRNVRSARLDYPWTFYLTGQVIHGGVYFLIELDLYKGKIRVRAKVEAKADNTRSIASLAMESRNPATCINCKRTGFTTVFSNSRADVFCPDI